MGKEFRGAGSIKDSTAAAIFNVGTNPFSMGGWFRSYTFGASVGSLLLAKMNGAFTRGYYLQANSGSGSIQFVIIDETGNSSEVDIQNAQALGLWYHLICTRNGSRMKLYLFGKMAGESDDGNTRNQTTAGTFTAGNSDAGIRILSGSVAEVFFYNREVLPEEAERLPYYPATQVSTLNLQLYWPLRSVSSPEQDLSGNGRTGTVITVWPGPHPPMFERFFYRGKSPDSYYGDLRWFNAPIFPVIPTKRVFPVIPAQRVSPIISTKRNRGPY